FRWAEGRYERLPRLAAELVKLDVSAITALGAPAALAAVAATKTIAVAFMSSVDPVKVGLVASFALTGSVGFAVGTIFLKRYPIQLPDATSATWQIAIGSVPIALAGTLLEHPHIAALSSAGWFALGYI